MKRSDFIFLGDRKITIDQLIGAMDHFVQQYESELDSPKISQTAYEAAKHFLNGLNELDEDQGDPVLVSSIPLES